MKYRLLLVLVLCVMPAEYSEGRTIYVVGVPGLSDPAFETIQGALNAAASDSSVDVIEIYEVPVSGGGPNHVLWDSKPGLSGTENGRLKAAATLDGVTMRGNPQFSQIVTIDGNGGNVGSRWYTDTIEKRSYRSGGVDFKSHRSSNSCHQNSRAIFEGLGLAR